MRILKIKVNDSKKWIGGLYYKRNILFSLLQNQYIRSNYRIQVHSTLNNLQYFEPFEQAVELVNNDESRKNGKVRALLYEALHPGMYEFPSGENVFRDACGVKAIQWIPDFQHNYYPEYFTREECLQRTNQYKKIQKNELPLVLSSLNCRDDFERFYGKKEGTYVVPFVSFLQPELEQISSEFEQSILKEKRLERGGYACISNQFWKHKNHIVVLEAIKKLAAQNMEFKFVFTGYPKDYRNPEYYNTLQQLFNDPQIEPHVNIVGFVDRIEQITLMKNAAFIIQPSLFEGWGTVVEDAKVLDKTILLSDIPVHREQMNSKCKLFDPTRSDELAQLISEEMFIRHNDDIEFGIADMYKRAKEYSKGFEQLLRDQEGKNK